MNSKLEEKLLQYKIENKQEMLNAVKSILKEEESKESNEQDIDLIDEAVDAILSFDGVDTDELDAEADELADKIINESGEKAVTTKPKKNKVIRIKWLIPVAVIISLLISATIVGYAMGYDVLEMTNSAFKQLKKHLWYDDGKTSIIVTDDVVEYTTYDEMLEKEGFDHLLWIQASESNCSTIKVFDFGEYKEIYCELTLSGEAVDYSIKIPQFFDVSNADPIRIGSFDVCVYEYDGIYQANFYYEGNTYTIETSSYDTLQNFIENLKEK